MACASSCGSSPAEAPPNSLSPEQSLQNDNDSCCDGENLAGNQASKGACCKRELRHPALTKLACNDGDRSSKHELIEDQGCKPTNPLGAGSCQDTRVSGTSEPAKEGNCCGGTKDMEDDGCRPPEIVSTCCQNGCCDGPTNKTQGGAGSGTRNVKFDNDCCTPKSNDHGCQKSYLSAPEKSHIELPERPSCCKDKAFPCCDVSCLDRIAWRECKDQRPAAQGGEESKSRLKRNLQRRQVLLMLTIYRYHQI